jgi:AraC-type DNA-binding domain-containing proteins
MGMLVNNIFKPFEIEFVTTEKCPIKIHKNTFFQLVYMVEGSGIYHVNENRFNYQAGQLFLLRPMVVQYTEVQEKTSFLFIRFNSIYLKSQQSAGATEWVNKLEYILSNGHHVQGPVIQRNEDKPLVNALAAAIIQEYQDKQSWHMEVMQQLVNTFITIVARNIPMHFSHTEGASRHLSLDMLGYIHEHIYEPEKLKAEQIASHFNISLNYISEYFKKHMKQTLQQYILTYKLSLVATRLHYSDKRLNEIADEFGFTDESHLNKMFRKYRGVSPAVYRKTALEAQS